ncbi:MAG: gliding motility lipoprotein GldH [Bacteroidota bacterium]
MKILKHLFYAPVLSALFSCNSDRVFDEYNDFEESFWHMDSVQVFEFMIDDTSTSYDLFATFRNSASYPFYNLYFQYEIKDSTNQVLLTELKDVSLFDPKTGEPLGSGLGDLFDHSFLLEEDFQFEQTGRFTLALQHYMRRDTLPLILSVGARIEKVTE